MNKIKVKTSEEYFNIPRKQRTNKLGFFLNPYSLPFDFDKNSEWDKFEQGIKKEFPFQWFLRIFIVNQTSDLQYEYKKIKRKVKNFISPNHKRFRKSYPRTAYKDLDVLLPDAIFAAFLDFWHEEVYPDSFVDWGNDWENREYSDDEIGQFERESAKSHYETFCWMKQVAEDIEFNLPKLEKEVEEELNVAHKNRSKGAYDEIYRKHDELSKKYHEEETRIMKEIIDNREKLWT